MRRNKMYRWSLCLIACGVASTAMGADFLSYSGQQLYQRFCSGCHGVNAHGDGKIAPSLDVAVPDLTLLAQRNRGEFPRERLVKIIDGRITIGKHINRTMPIWGEELLRGEQGDTEAEHDESILINKIVDYLESIQSPAANTAKDTQ